MKFQKIVTFLSLVIATRSYAQVQDFIYINSNNQSQTGTPAKSFQYAKQVTITNFQVSGTSGGWYCKPADIVNAPPSLDKNFVRSEVLLDKYSSEAAISVLGNDKKAVDYAYGDDLGRQSQAVKMKASPSETDIVTAVGLDARDRVKYQYLPYAGFSGRAGSYQTNFVNDVDRFYSTATKVAHDKRHYTENSFELSPLDRPTESYGPGQAWFDNGKKKSSTAKVDMSASVYYWRYVSETSPPILVTFNGNNIGTYPPGTITLTELTDEQGNITREYTDFKGLVVMKEALVGTNWLQTYNIYDLSGQLRVVIPPEASRRLSNEYNTGGITDQQKIDFLNRWAFQYVYDEYGRMIKKRAPGMKDTFWTMMVYDKWDRLVLTREPGWLPNEWLFTKYDVLNRPIITGIYSTSTAHSQLQLDAMASNVHHEDARTNDVTGYYFTNSYPAGVSESNLRTVTYYDTYWFSAFSGWDAEGFNYSFSSAEKLDPVPGYVTGSKVRVLDNPGTRWLNTVTYYDKKYRTLYVVGENFYGGTDKTTSTYDFAGKVTSVQHVHTTSYENITLIKQYSYDDAGRLLNVTQTTGSGTPVVLVANSYNELGQVVEKNYHSSQGSPFLQSVDYRYNIRGWTTNINNSTLSVDANNDDANDLFGMDILYQQQETINGTGTSARYDGNISSIRWKTNNLSDPPKEKIFGLNYDNLNRLTGMTYAEKSSSVWNSAVNMYTEAMSYDQNGNIRTLARTLNYNGAPTQVDNLTYKYGNNSSGSAFDNWGNRLFNVHDGATNYYNSADKNPAYGYSETSHDPLISEYDYDNSGRMIRDDNREIVSMLYNYLNRPVAANLSDDRDVYYTYDAAGNKLQTQVQDAASTFWTSYVGPFHYTNGALDFVLTDEGRAVKNTSGGFDYEYFLKDHQGNTRAVFGYMKETKNYLATMETSLASNEEDPQGMGFKIPTAVRVQMLNHTPRSSQLVIPDRSAETNGFLGKTIGPAKTLVVGAGDRLQIETYARYNTGTGSSNAVVANLASAVPLALGFSLGENAYSALSNAVPGQAATVGTTTGVPKGYVCYFLFDNNYVFRQFGYKRISTVASSLHERLIVDAVMPYAGYVYVFVANESNVNSASSVYFDDLSIIHEKNNPALQVTQSTDYLPFGLTFNEFRQARAGLNSNVANIHYSQNKYTFQNQELQTGFDIGWYEFKFRMHNPAIGRFELIDPLADKYTYNSTYAFSENRLIDGVELEGKEFSTNEYSATYDLFVNRNSYKLDAGYFTGGLDMMSTGAMLRISEWSQWLPAPWQFHYEVKKYQEGREEYSDEFQMPQETKDLNHFVNKSNIVANGLNGANTMVGDFMFFQSVLSLGASAPFTMARPTTPLGRPYGVGKSGFWSGEGTELQALNRGYITLGQTRAGQTLEKLTADMPKGPGTFSNEMWARLSTTWSQGAAGQVGVFQNAQLGVSLESIWRMNEYPTLKSNPNVTNFAFHY